ncbi:MAG: YopX family protein [Candidatus Hodarchaeota archaeon]
MREIKFRYTFKNESNQFIQRIFTLEQIEHGDVYELFVEIGDEYELIARDEFTGTGLYDKNGKEYYHGDVFEWDGLTYCVENNFGGFGFYDKNQCWQWLYDIIRSFQHENEIIGNIHENLELGEQ